MNLFDPTTWFTKANPLKPVGTTYNSNNALGWDDGVVALATGLDAEETEKLTLKMARDISHTLHLKNPLAQGVTQAYRAGVIGSGIELSSEIKRVSRRNPDGKLVERANQEVERIWRAWTKKCTTDGQHSWFEATNKILTSLIESGEVFIIFNDVAPSRDMEEMRIPFSFDILEGDSCDEAYNGGPLFGNSDYWNQGIHLDRYGRPLEYALKTYTQNGLKQTAIFNARDILHLRFRDSERPGSVRGWPLLTPALGVLANIQTYMKTQLEHAINNSSTSAWLNQPRGAEQPRLITKKSLKALNEVKGGAVRLLPADTQVTERPQIPASNLDSFVRVTEKMVASAAHLTVSAITLDNRESNFSVSRLDTQLNRNRYKEVQTLLNEDLCEEIFNRLFSTVVLKNPIPAVDNSDIRNFTHSWRNTVNEPTEPLKAANTARTHYELGIKSRSTIAQEMGYDYEAEMRKAAKDDQLAEEYGQQERLLSVRKSVAPEDRYGEADTIGSGEAEDIREANN